ncbi:MAG: MBL fold metallo-hydrolase [Melioribacter sp.]|nr:MBL fold metallo-hydrolase [Melioribacter sp.]
MKIIFIGTGSGRTSVKRFHSSFLIKYKNYNLLVDAGDGISKALLMQKINYNILDAVLFSHYHADHFTGIGALITQMKLSKRRKTLKLFTHKNLTETLIKLINSVYMFKENLDFNLEIIGFSFDKVVRINQNINFIARQNSHIVQKENLKHYSQKLFVSSSFYFKIGQKKIFYSSDIGNKSDLYLFEDKPIDIMIVESMHVLFSDIYDAFLKIKPSKLLFTHIDELSEKELIKWHSKLKQAEKSKIVICYDGMKI